MAAYNFQSRFVAPIQAGTKRHTIRADRKDGRVPKVGEMLHLFCGMRTKGCFRILPQPVECTKTHSIQIRIVFIASACQLKEETVVIDGQKLDKSEMETLAQADGFPDWNQMRWFWIKAHGKAKRAMGSRYQTVNFSGNIIHWR